MVYTLKIEQKNNEEQNRKTMNKTLSKVFADNRQELSEFLFFLLILENRRSFRRILRHRVSTSTKLSLVASLSFGGHDFGQPEVISVAKNFDLWSKIFLSFVLNSTTGTSSCGALWVISPSESRGDFGLGLSGSLFRVSAARFSSVS